MSGTIHLLPESTANQIAAGEVVQRPASVVKELLENAVDAGATHIKLYIKNGGISFIQVDDNGKGMNAFDARMCWERHATSKITRAEDLYNLHTLGFRGEALASIASVAQVEMKTKAEEEEVGTHIVIDAGKVLEQEAVAATQGTNIQVKNLFFNIPARKNFLKSITAETKHVFDEFQRIALAYPGIAFDFYNQDKAVSKLRSADLKKRVSELLNVKEEHLINTSEQTEIVGITGFLGSPKLAKKTRGNQFLFANGRFIKDHYLHHAIAAAYTGIMEAGEHPFYVLFLDVDPAKIDVNIHPTKHEVKFEDGRHVYSLLNAVVKKSLSAFFVLPNTLDLKQMAERDFSASSKSFKSSSPDTRFNPFEPQKERIRSEWEKLDELLRSEPEQSGHKQISFFEETASAPIDLGGTAFQVANAYIVLNRSAELWLVNQHRAHEQILYERYKSRLNKPVAAQQLLFPRTLELSPADFQLLSEMTEEIKSLGFDVSEFGKNTFILNGLPAELSKSDGTEILQQILDDFKENFQELKSDKPEALIRAAAKNAAIKAGTALAESEIKQILGDLLQCKQYNMNHRGAPILIKLDHHSLERFFQ